MFFNRKTRKGAIPHPVRDASLGRTDVQQNPQHAVGMQAFLLSIVYTQFCKV